MRPAPAGKLVRKPEQELGDARRLPDREHRIFRLPAHTAPLPGGDMEAFVEKAPGDLALQSEIGKTQRSLTSARIAREKSSGAPVRTRAPPKRRSTGCREAPCSPETPSGLVVMAAEHPLHGVGQGPRLTPGSGSRCRTFGGALPGRDAQENRRSPLEGDFLAGGEGKAQVVRCARGCPEIRSGDPRRAAGLRASGRFFPPAPRSPGKRTSTRRRAGSSSTSVREIPTLPGRAPHSAEGENRRTPLRPRERKRLKG